MELTVNGTGFAWNRSYDLLDASGQPVYRAALKKSGMLAHSVRLFTPEGKLAAEAEGLEKKVLPTYQLKTEGRLRGTLKRRFTLFGAHFALPVKPQRLEGRPLKGHFRVVKDGQTLASYDLEGEALRLVIPEEDALFHLLQLLTVAALLDLKHY